ncbi:MAG: alkaline phosphatase family protein [Candidatus Bathyarchaeaceae archaeon]
MRTVIASSRIQVLIVVIILSLALYPEKSVGDKIIPQEENDQIKNVILISWDGVQRGHLQELLDQNKLPNLQALITEGGNTVVGIAPFIKVMNGAPIITSSGIKLEDEIYFEHAVTDSGHARMLTGRWNHLTGIYDVYENASAEWIDYICSNNLYTARDDLTIMEILKKKMPEFKVGVASSRHADLRKIKDQYENLASIFRGWGDDTIYMLIASEGIQAVGDHGFFSTTFSNATPDLDFFFDSDYYLTHMPIYPYNYGYLPIWDYTTFHLVFLAELKDDAVATEAMNWIRSVKEDRFFLFIHFCEPDLFGHIYGENSGNYSEAIISNDQALGIIVNELKQLGIYNETLTIVTTDHGATENAPGATFYIDGLGRKWVTSLGPLHGQLDENNHVIWMVNNKFSHLPYPVTYQTDIVPFILHVLGFPSHDIGIIDLSSSKTVVEQGYNLQVSAQLLNYGSNAERFNLTIYANETAVQTIEITLPSWNSSIITFTWNTTGFAKGKYIVSANADPVPDEVDTTDNIFTDGIIEITEIAIPVGGIYIPVNKLNLLTPYIGLTILLAVVVIMAVGYVKPRNRKGTFPLSFTRLKEASER